MMDNRTLKLIAKLSLKNKDMSNFIVKPWGCLHSADFLEDNV